MFVTSGLNQEQIILSRGGILYVNPNIWDLKLLWAYPLAQKRGCMLGDFYQYRQKKYYGVWGVFFIRDIKETSCLTYSVVGSELKEVWPTN